MASVRNMVVRALADPSPRERWYPAPVPNQAAGPLLPAEPSRRGRYVPAILDAIIPGLGHLFAGRRRRALLLPGADADRPRGRRSSSRSRRRRRGIAASLVESGVLWALLAFQGFLLVWRLLAVGSSLTAPGLPKLQAKDAIPVALLLLVVIVPQVYAGYGTEVARETAEEIFVEEPAPVAAGPSVAPEPDPSFLETAEPSASASLDPSLSPSPSAPVSQRINALVARRRRRRRAQHLPDRHDDRRLDGPGDRDGLDGLDPARHGRRAARRRAQVHRQDQRPRRRTPATIPSSSRGPTGPGSTSSAARSASCSGSTSSTTRRSTSVASSRS